MPVVDSFLRSASVAARSTKSWRVGSATTMSTRPPRPPNVDQRGTPDPPTGLAFLTCFAYLQNKIQHTSTLGRSSFLRPKSTILPGPSRSDVWTFKISSRHALSDTWGIRGTRGMRETMDLKIKNIDVRHADSDATNLRWSRDGLRRRCSGGRQQGR